VILEPKKPSIFRKYFTPETLVDRYLADPSQGVDVIIPVMHTNELWVSNLHSIYREIPVRRLLLGDGGCIDDTIERARPFPRVEVFNHREFKSLGFSIRKLIEEVKTDWFVYLHSDVWLPPQWFETMCKNKDKYDWFECRQHLTILLDYPLDYSPANMKRPFSGSQMGRRTAFDKVLPQVDDDYLYRNEDVIFADLVERQGFKYGRVDETYHCHQHMTKPGPFERKVFVDYKIEATRAEEVRASMMAAKSIVKYMKPGLDQSLQIWGHQSKLIELGEMTYDDFRKWVAETNPAWLPYIYKRFPLPPLRVPPRKRVYNLAKKVYRALLT